MEFWNSYTGEMILEPIIDENGKVSNEAALEDQFKHAIYSSSNGELNLVKLYWTDGFGWYFGENNKIIFVLHECKANIKAKTMRGYTTCLKKALLQNIGYYFKIKHGKYTNFPKKLKDLATNYNSVQDFIIDNFGMFLMTNEKFVSHVELDSKVKELINKLEPLVLKTDKSPSTYWSDIEMRTIMESFDVLDYAFKFTPDIDIADTGVMLNNILNKNE